MEVIRVRNLSKQFGAITAVDDISFSVNKGEIYGFLGQNGAGKSTTIRMLLTLVEPTAGDIEMFGMELRHKRREILKRVGAVIERPDLYKYLSAIENLSIFGLLGGHRLSRQQMMQQLDLVGLASRADSLVKTYSQGMRQRLGIAVALVSDPELIILDEPTNGLDPQGIADVRNLILQLSRNSGKTVFVSSHLLSEIEVLADRMLILDRGRKAVEGSKKDLLDPSRMHVDVQMQNVDQIKAKIIETGWRSNFMGAREDGMQFLVNKDQIPTLASDLVGLGARIISIQHKHSLEQYFLSLTTQNQHVDAFKN